MCFWAVFESHFGHFVCKMGQNGVIWVNLRFLRVPDPSGIEIMQIFFEKTFLAYFGPKGLRKISGPAPKK